MTASTLKTPVLTRKRVRIRPSLFVQKSGKTAVFALNAAERSGALRFTGGKRFLNALPAGTERLFSTEDGALFSWDGSSLHRGDAQWQLSSPPLDVLSFPGEEGRGYFVLLAEGLYSLGEEGAEAVAEAPAGTCMAVHGERLFLASGETLSYSAPLAPDDWAQSADGAGSIDLPSAGGAIGRLISHRGRLFLFRERGITALTAPGDFLGFRAEEIAFACGKLIPSSAAACGSRAVFCTENGVFSLRGDAVSPVEGCGAEYIDWSKGATAVSAGEQYYAAVTLKSGERCILSVEDTGAAILRLGADSLAGGKELQILLDGKLYALDKEGAGDREMLVEFPLSDGGLSEVRYLDAVRVEGEGHFRIEVRAERGLPRFVRGRAGEEMRLMPPLKGSAFAFRVKAPSGARLKELCITLREGRP